MSTTAEKNDQSSRLVNERCEQTPSNVPVGGVAQSHSTTFCLNDREDDGSPSEKDEKVDPFCLEGSLPISEQQGNCKTIGKRIRVTDEEKESRCFGEDSDYTFNRNKEYVEVSHQRTKKGYCPEDEACVKPSHLGLVFDDKRDLKSDLSQDVLRSEDRETSEYHRANYGKSAETLERQWILEHCALEAIKTDEKVENKNVLGTDASGNSESSTATPGGHECTDRTSVPENTNCTDDSTGKTNKSFQNAVSLPIDTESAEKFPCRQGKRDQCLPKRPDALELNLASFAEKECQENHHQQQQPGEGSGYSGFYVQPSCGNICDSQLNSFGAEIGLVSQDQTFKYSTRSESIDNYSSVHVELDREESRSVSEEFNLDVQKKHRGGRFPKFSDGARDNSASCVSEGSHIDLKFSHRLYTYAEQPDFCLNARGQNLEEPDITKGNVCCTNDTNSFGDRFATENSIGASDNGAVKASNEQTKLQYSGFSGTKPAFKSCDISTIDKYDKGSDLCPAAEGSSRRRKISSAGLHKHHFYQRNIDGTPRCRSLPPLSLQPAGVLSNTKLSSDKVSNNGVSVDSNVGYDKTCKDNLLANADCGPISESQDPDFSIMENNNADVIASERKPHLGRSYSFRSSTLGRIRKKRSHSLESTKSVEETLGLVTGDRSASKNAELERQNMAASVRTKPKLPNFNPEQENSTESEADPSMEELKKMLDVLKVDFVRKYSRDPRSYTPGTSSPRSLPLSPGSSLPSSCQASLSDLQARLNSVKFLTTKLRAKHGYSPVQSPTADFKNQAEEPTMGKAKSVGDMLQEDPPEGLIEKPIRRTRSAKDHELVLKEPKEISQIGISGREARSFHDVHRDGHAPRDRPGSPFKTTMSESLDSPEPGGLPFNFSPSRSLLAPGEICGDSSAVNEIGALPRLRRVKDTSVFTKQTTVVQRKTSPGSHGILQRAISVESTEVQSEHEESVTQLESGGSVGDEETSTDGCDTRNINVQVLDENSKLDDDQPLDTDHDTASAAADLPSVGDSEKGTSGDSTTPVSAGEGGVSKRDEPIEPRAENRLSSEDEGLGITESDASTENISVDTGSGKSGDAWSCWPKIIQPKPIRIATNVSIAEQFNMIARQQSRLPEGDEEEDTAQETTAEGPRTPRKSRRTVTHPTFSATKHPLIGEIGSLDSNGLGSLHDRRTLGASGISLLTPNPSEGSLADTGFTPSEDLETTPEEVDVVSSEPLDREKLDKKCTKSPKTKSKSDPLQQQGELEFRQTIHTAHALSSPSIACQGRSSSPEITSTEEKCAKKSLSDNFLALQEAAEASGDSASESADVYKVPIIDHRSKPVIRDKPPVGPTPIPAPRRVSKKQRAKSNVEIPQAEKDRHPSSVCTGSDDDSGHSGSRGSTRSNTAPNTPNTQSPTGSLERKAILSQTGSLDRRTANTLSLSGPGRAVVGRSKSTASVFSNAVKKKYQPGNGGTCTSVVDIAAESPLRKQSYDSKMSPGTSDPDLQTPTRLSTCSTSSGDTEPWNRTSPCATPPKERSPPLAFRHDKRFHIVQELYNVEKEYVEAMKILVHKYRSPLMSGSIIDSALVDDIFYKIPEILNHHAFFLDFLERAFLNWDENQTVGQHIRNTFSKESVVDSYVSFIENYKTSERNLENLLSNKTAVKFIEQCQRETRGKLPLKALIIMPAQRIPRYELLLRRLIEHTPKDHEDHQLLLEAENAIHELALKINAVRENKQKEILQESLKQLELLLMTDLSVPERIYIRHDMVAVMSRKDQCCLWLFSDLLVMSAIKRKTGLVKKASLRLQSPSGQDFVDNVKHKVWLRIGLDDVDIIKTASLTRRSTVDKDVLEEDYSLLSQALELTNKLNCSHQILEETIKDMMTSLQKQIVEHQGRAQEFTRLDLMTTTQEGVNIIGVIFPTMEKRLQWELVFAEAKQKLATLTDRKPPDFMQSLPITKTRAGMQFSCAAPIDGLNANNYRDVWVCNSDGHVGHMCLLSLEPEPIVTLNTPVPGCNSRILCVCAVPAQAQPFKRMGSCKGCRRQSCLIHTPKSSDKLEGDSSSSSDDSSSDEDEEEFADAEATVKSSDEEEKEPKSCSLYDPFKSTMWLGTEDGCIMIFQCTDNIKTTRNKQKIQQAASVLSIVYLDNKLFVSLANGDLIVYRRLSEGAWNVDKPETKVIGTKGTPISRMLVVAGKLWCGCHREVIVVNPTTVQIERSFLLPTDSDRPICCMACSSKGVWIAVQNSSKVSLFNATSCDFLVEVNIAHVVAQKLAATDDIIRQHKTACLRITALMACKDLLWVGTSAGIILNVVLPIISTTTTRFNIDMPNITGLFHGHTGHVRFLTSVEMPVQLHQGEANMPSRRASMTPAAATMATKMLVISGGDGYEDFRGNTNESEQTGKDDSTNHLLLWQV